MRKNGILFPNKYWRSRLVRGMRGPPSPVLKFLKELFKMITPRALQTFAALLYFKEKSIMEKTVEFKIRVPQADRWEDTPVYRSKTLSGTADEIGKQAQEIAEGIAFSQSSDVRWNYAGDTQGHYVDEIFPQKQMASTKSLGSLMSSSESGSGIAI
jgi:succinate dehydrogenase flavin-adding protein (antitoxin of CptAB toxin-antitoxin module)